MELEDSEPEHGDIFPSKLTSPTGHCCGAHVGVHCGHGEVINIQGGKSGGHWPRPFLGSCKEGAVSKLG